MNHSARRTKTRNEKWRPVMIEKVTRRWIERWHKQTERDRE